MFQDFDPKKETARVIKFISQATRKAGFDRVIVAASGGVDSSTTLTLATKALGPKNVLVALLPNKEINQDNDAELVIKKLKIPPGNVFEIEITEIVKSFLDQLGQPARRQAGLEPLRLGNLMARVRMIILYDLAKKQQALVCGTENKSEYLLGYFTRFGDEASDLEPIRHLYKTQIIQLAGYLGVPPKIIKKPPSAGLWKGQTDENELGFAYQDADQVLFLHFEKKYSWEKIKKSGFKKELVEKVKKRAESNFFKHIVPTVCR